MFKVGDKVIMTPARIHEFRNNPQYGVAPRQVYTISEIRKGDGQCIVHGFPWRMDGTDKSEGGSCQQDLVLYNKVKKIKAWSF